MISQTCFCFTLHRNFYRVDIAFVWLHFLFLIFITALTSHGQSVDLQVLGSYLLSFVQLFALPLLFHLLFSVLLIWNLRIRSMHLPLSELSFSSDTFSVCLFVFSFLFTLYLNWSYSDTTCIHFKLSNSRNQSNYHTTFIYVSLLLLLHLCLLIMRCSWDPSNQIEEKEEGSDATTFSIQWFRGNGTMQIPHIRLYTEYVCCRLLCVFLLFMHKLVLSHVNVNNITIMISKNCFSHFLQCDAPRSVFLNDSEIKWNQWRKKRLKNIAQPGKNTEKINEIKEFRQTQSHSWRKRMIKRGNARVYIDTRTHNFVWQMRITTRNQCHVPA